MTLAVSLFLVFDACCCGRRGIFRYAGTLFPKDQRGYRSRLHGQSFRHRSARQLYTPLSDVSSRLGLSSIEHFRGDCE